MDTLDYSIKAIPTEFKGRLYRSRLEAKWASFFDRCGWHAEYEPYDLGSWSPDFLISQGDNQILVEVKPISEVHVPTIYKMYSAAKQAEFSGDLLLVGTGLKPDEYGPIVGWACSNECPEDPFSSTERNGLPDEMRLMPWFCRSQIVPVKGGTPDILIATCSTSRSGKDHVTGLVTGRELMRDWMPIYQPVGETEWRCNSAFSDAVLEQWSLACNAVQWTPRRH